MNSYVHQYPAALFSRVTESGYHGELNTGEILRSGHSQRSGQRRGLLGWLRPSSRGQGGEGAQAGQPRNRQAAHPAPAPHHFELKFHRERHAR
jgi:hypothetical protein